MASLTWQGTAPAVAMTWTLTVGGTWEADDLAKITLYDEAGNATLMSIVSGSTTIATICTTIAAAVNAVYTAGTTTSPFYYVSATAGATTVTLTARTAGVPIYCSVTTTETGGGAADAQTFSAAIGTANSGPSDFHTAANWSTGAVPAASDSVYIDGTSSVSILYGLYQNTALTLNSSVTLTLLKIERGAPQIGTLLAGLTHKITTLDIGADPADGGRSLTSSSLWHIKPGNIAVAATVRSTANQGTSGKAPLLLDIDNASATLSVLGSSLVGLATAIQGETSTIGTLTVKDQAKVTGGAGLTLTTLNPEGGSTLLNAGCTTVNNGDGEVIIRGTGNITTVNAGGVFEWDSSGTLSTYNGFGKSLGKFWRGTVSDAQIYGKEARVDASISGIPLNCTFTNGVDVLGGAIGSQINYGDNVKVSQAAIS